MCLVAFSTRFVCVLQGVPLFVQPLNLMSQFETNKAFVVFCTLLYLKCRNFLLFSDFDGIFEVL